MLDARRIAHRVLVRVDQGGAFANRALDAAISEAGVLDPRDVALATELTYGTIRRQVAIDHVLARFSKQALTDLEADTRALLRLGAHQLLHMRIPERASVHATVELAKEIRSGRPVPYVNAVLRSIVRERANLKTPSAEKDPAGFLEHTESFPRWLVDELLAERGFDKTRSFLAALNRPAPLHLRVNERRAKRAEVIEELARQGIRASPTPYSPVGIAVEATAPAALLRPEEGRWQAQDEAAQLVGHFAAPSPGQRVLDACAAPGGKTCHLAELMDDRGQLDAIDVHPGKVKEITEGARRLGLGIVRAQASDASLPLTFAPAGGYDLVLADAPCSGLGTVRRHPEVKNRRIALDVERLAELQSRILDNVAGHVKPGGVLVYALCTFTSQEGFRQIDAFLARHPEFARAAPPPGPVDWAPLLDERGDLVLTPDVHGTDAFYAARLVRRGSAS